MAAETNLFVSPLVPIGPQVLKYIIILFSTHEMYFFAIKLIRINYILELPILLLGSFNGNYWL